MKINDYYKCLSLYFFTAGSLFFLANDLHPRYIYKFSNHYRKSIISENVFCSMSTAFPAYTFLFESPSHKMKKRQMNLEQSSVSLNIWYSNFVFCGVRQSDIKQQTVLYLRECHRAKQFHIFGPRALRLLVE